MPADHTIWATSRAYSEGRRPWTQLSVGDLSKRLTAANPARFDDPLWSQAARNRDFVVHHYDRVDAHALWVTVSRSFPELRHLLERLRDD